MRTRERGFDRLTQSTVKTSNGSPIDSRSYLGDGLTETITDVVTPDYHRRIANGEIINNPCSYLKTEVDSPSGGYYHAVGYGYTVVTSGGNLTAYQVDLMLKNLSFNGWAAVPARPTLEGADYAQLVAMARVDASPHGFAEDIAEYRETLRYLRRPSVSLEKLSRKFYRDVETSIRQRKRKRPGKFKDALQRKEEILDAAADVWLGYRFAAMPLSRTLQEGVEYLHEVQNDSKRLRPPPRRTARGFKRSEFDLPGTARGHWSPTVYDDFEGRRTGFIEHRAGILYQVTNPVHDVPFHLGVRLKDMPVTAWNVVPLSFMVDRVSDISSAIKALTFLADPSIKVLAAWVTSKEEDVQELKYVSEVNPGYTVTVTPVPLTHKWFKYNRTPWTPSLSDIKPGFTPRQLISDATSIADLTALVKKRFALVGLLK